MRTLVGLGLALALVAVLGAFPGRPGGAPGGGAALVADASGIAAVPAGGAVAPRPLRVDPRLHTGPAGGDADDCALWVNSRDPGRSIVIGTGKGKMPGLYVWGLDGRELQHMPFDRPNNVDVRQGVRLGGRGIDVAVANDRRRRTLRVFAIDAGALAEITTADGIPTPELDDPYGICLYMRPADGALFAIASTKEGDTRHLHQYRLEDDGRGGVRGAHVRRFAGTIRDIVEGLVADDALGWVYAADESYAVRKFHADPDAGQDSEVAVFAETDAISGHREGLALYPTSATTGWILLSSQGDHTLKVYRREGEGGDPHRHVLLATIATKRSRSTDGLDATAASLGAAFPSGLLAKHDAPTRSFALYSWDAIAAGF